VMVYGAALTATIAVIIVVVSVLSLRSTPESHLEIVPPNPSFDVADRRIDLSSPLAYLPPDRPSLRELAEQAGLLIGAAVEPDDMAWEAPYKPLVAREFNVVATENTLKFGLIRKT